MYHTDHFDRDQQRNWYEVHQGDEPHSCLLDEEQPEGELVVLVVRVDVPEVVALEERPDRDDDRAEQAEDELDQHGDEDVGVGLLGDLGPFHPCIRTVLHDLRLMASVDADADDPLCIPQAAAAEQDLIRIDRNDTTVLQAYITLKLVKMLVSHCRKIKLKLDNNYVD